MAEETVEQDSEFFKGSLDIDSLFTKIPLEETIDICTNTLFENTERVEGLPKIEFKELLSLAIKESYFTFNEKLCKKVDTLSKGSPLGPKLANAFLVYFEKNSLQDCLSDFKPHYYRRYVDDIFNLFNSPEAFRKFLNRRHANMSLTIENGKQDRMSFLDVQIIRENFMSKCFKRFMGNLNMMKQLKRIFLYLGSMSLQTRTKLKKSFKISLIVVKYK